MGNNSSSISETDLENLAGTTNYSQDQIKRIYSKFSELSKDSGSVTIEDLRNACDLENSEISNLVLSQFKCGLDQVNFEQLIKVLSAFQQNQEEKKLKCKHFIHKFEPFF